MGSKWQVQGLIAAILVALTLLITSSAEAAYASPSSPIIVPGDEVFLITVILIKLVIFAVLGFFVIKSMRENK